MPFKTPNELQAALNRGDSHAAKEFERLFIRSVAESACELGISTTPDEILNQQLWQWGIRYLRSCSSEALPHDFETFAGGLRVAADRALRDANSEALALASMVDEVPQEAARPCGAIQIASRTIRSASYGTDILLFESIDDQQWLLLADVVAFGSAARSSAVAIERLWRGVLTNRIRKRSIQSPADMLDAIARELKPVIPDGVFVDVLILQAINENQKSYVHLASAGVARCVKYSRIRKSPLQIDLLCGSSLFSVTPKWGTKKLVLKFGDEFLFGTDGLFDQRTSKTRFEEHLRNQSTQQIRLHGLASVMQLALEETLRDHTPTDDITWLSITLPCECGQRREKPDCESLVKAFVDGNRDEFHEIERRFSARINQIAHEIFREQNTSLVEDATQKTWSNTLAKNDNTGESELAEWLHNTERPPFCFWLATIARRAAIDIGRKNGLIKTRKPQKGELQYDPSEKHWFVWRRRKKVILLEGVEKTDDSQRAAERRWDEIFNRVIRPLPPDAPNSDGESEDPSEVEERGRKELTDLLDTFFSSRKSPELRQVFDLIFIEDKTYREAAEILGVSEKTISNRLDQFSAEFTAWLKNRGFVWDPKRGLICQ